MIDYAKIAIEVADREMYIDLESDYGVGDDWERIAKEFAVLALFQLHKQIGEIEITPSVTNAVGMRSMILSMIESEIVL